MTEPPLPNRHAQNNNHRTAGIGRHQPVNTNRIMSAQTITQEGMRYANARPITVRPPLYQDNFVRSQQNLRIKTQ